MTEKEQHTKKQFGTSGERTEGTTAGNPSPETTGGGRPSSFRNMSSRPMDLEDEDRLQGRAASEEEGEETFEEENSFGSGTGQQPTRASRSGQPSEFRE